MDVNEKEGRDFPLSKGRGRADVTSGIGLTTCKQYTGQITVLESVDLNYGYGLTLKY